MSTSEDMPSLTTPEHEERHSHRDVDGHITDSDSSTVSSQGSHAGDQDNDPITQEAIRLSVQCQISKHIPSPCLR